MNSAHAAFLATQDVHPILQQLQTMSQLYPGFPPDKTDKKDDLDDLILAGTSASTNNNASTDDVSLDIAQEGLQESASEEVFSTYRHRPVVEGCQPHPGDIVEAAPLAALDLPKEYYPITDSLPKEAISEGKLSSLQLEGIIHACQRHQMILANGQRAGFFIGDGAGVGKGRQIAGIVLDNIARGRTRHIWFTISGDLIVDSRRDLTDIGCHTKVINGCQELDKETKVLGLPAGFKEGVVFSTYATLVSSVQTGAKFSTARKTRLQQLIDWCGGPEFEGCLIFDECHKAKNFVPNKETASTKVALAVAAIQRLVPKARVVYCSATGVSDVKNMAFMERLGLWGDGAPFRSFEDFLDTVQKKGLGVAEMLAMEMKSSGMDEIRRSLGHAINRTGYVNARIWTTFWGAHQRFFKQLCMGLKVPAVVAEAKAALDNGQCVVIGLQSTGEASLDQEAMSAKWECTGFVSVCRELLSRFVRAEFPTKKVGATEEDEWSVKAKQMLLEFAAKIKLPDSPLDELIDKLGGADQVAEMTGRRARIVRRWPQSKPVYEQRALQGKDNSLENLNVKERNMFMEGKKLVAIISDAASTGISLHADERAGNRRRRVHITMELPWSADKAVQQLGRSHRSNQSCGPLYKLLTTDLGGERRFAAAVARRLQSLGALTKGDRRAATGADLTEFNFDTPYGRSALKTIYTCICQDCLLLMGVVDDTTLVRCARVSDAYLSDVSKFLNRILGLRTDHQNMIFSYFTECMDVIVQNAKREGRYDEGLLDITAASIKMVGQPREVFRNLQRGHGTTNLVELLVDRGMDWDHALTRYENYKAGSSMTGFYVSKRDMFGRKMYILVTPKESSPHLFRVARPSTGVSGFDQEKTDLLHKYTPISIEKAKEGWVRGYELSEKSCMHGSHCKHKGTCTVGKRCYTLHMLCGNIATLMSVLESALVRNAPGLGLSKFESRLRVVRVAVDSGERVVGVRYPEVLIPEVERVLAYKQQAAGAGASSDAANLPSSQPGPSSSQDKPFIRSQAKVEAVSPVDARLLAKALRPPVTIKSFFKPCSAASVSNGKDGAGCSSAKEDCGSVAGEKDSRTKTTEKAASKVNVSASVKKEEEESPLKFGLTEDSSRVCETDSKQGSESDKNATLERVSEVVSQDSQDSASVVSEDSVKSTADHGDAEEDEEPETPRTRRGRKRKCVQPISATQTKKSKKSKAGKGSDSAAKRCPICNMRFDPRSSLADINTHVDGCLIK
ncbi:hypothetical protein BaRGS_00003982 [Batillaria attramentaria]|uniref:Uncharacterized protein n=1 Tax=Batillaria attramentaria TaxID=370345 RepID=A0ABD0M0X0_9CAEN